MARTAVQHQRVSVGVVEGSHVTHTGVERVAVELHASGFGLGSRGSNIRNPQRKPRWARSERLADARRVEDVERHLACTELDVMLASALDREAQRLSVEVSRAGDVLGQERHEIHALHLDSHGASIERCAAPRPVEQS
jgi:hypothetical protein